MTARELLVWLRDEAVSGNLPARAVAFPNGAGCALQQACFRAGLAGKYGKSVDCIVEMSRRLEATTGISRLFWAWLASNNDRAIDTGGYSRRKYFRDRFLRQIEAELAKFPVGLSRSIEVPMVTLCVEEPIELVGVS